MDTRVRTTINLPQTIYAAAKEAAFYRKTTFTRLIEEGLMHILAHDSPKKATAAQFVGGRSMKVKETKREEIYEGYLRKKVSS